MVSVVGRRRSRRWRHEKRGVGERVAAPGSSAGRPLAVSGYCRVGDSWASAPGLYSFPQTNPAGRPLGDYQGYEPLVSTQASMGRMKISPPPDRRQCGLRRGTPQRLPIRTRRKCVVFEYVDNHLDAEVALCAPDTLAKALGP